MGALILMRRNIVRHVFMIRARLGLHSPREGDKVIATARSLDKIRDFPKSGNIRLMELDITEGLANMKGKVNEAVTWFGQIDVLVNNAGVSVKATVEEGGYVL